MNFYELLRISIVTWLALFSILIELNTKIFDDTIIFQLITAYQSVIFFSTKGVKIGPVDVTFVYYIDYSLHFHHVANMKIF